MEKWIMHETENTAGGGGGFFKTRCEWASERWLHYNPNSDNKGMLLDFEGFLLNNA